MREYFDTDGQPLGANIRWDATILIDAEGILRLAEILPVAIASSETFSDTAVWAQDMLDTVNAKIEGEGETR